MDFIPQKNCMENTKNMRKTQKIIKKILQLYIFCCSKLLLLNMEANEFFYDDFFLSFR